MEWYNILALTASHLLMLSVGVFFRRSGQKQVVRPIATIKRKKEVREVEKDDTLFAIMMENVDNYDGSGLGQKSIPK